MRPARGHGLPGRVPAPPRRGDAAARRLGGRGAAGAGGVRRAAGLRARFSRAAATTRSARSGAARATSRRAEEAYARAERARPGPAARAHAAPAHAGQGRRGPAGIRRTLAETEDPLARLRHLPAQVEVAIADGDVPTGRRPPSRWTRSSTPTRSAGAAPRRSTARCTWPRGASPSPAATLRLRSPCCTRPAKTGRRSARRTRPRRHGWRSASRSGARATSTPATAELQAALAAFEKLGAKLDEAQCRDLLGKRERPAHLPLHRHRRLDGAARHARRGEVEAPAPAPQRAGA